ncbi:MAG: MFS transporter [Deltaproteobacteria bacterium]|jgi:UMF1 family MFS transporter|nr:MFS transporter [Deltaproteobacteria bacterium]
MEKERRKQILSWCLYDWANSAFAATIMAAVLPVFYSSVAGANLSKTTASSYWGYTNTLAMLVVAFSAPILGALADHRGIKKRFLALFAGMGIVSTSLLVFVGKGDWFLASLLYIIGMVGFSGGNNFYDSLLPHVAGEKDIDRISSLGYASGYLGGGILLAFNVAMILKPHWFGIVDAEWGTRYSFLTVGVWWAAFSIPILKNVPEPPIVPIPGESSNPLRASLQRLSLTFHNIRRYREAFKFLIAFWLFNDGIGTIISMAVIFGAEINIPQAHLIGSILAVQFIGIPFSIFFGRLAGWMGTKRAIFLGLAVYTGISIGGYFIQTALHFWILAVLVGFVQGGTQALSRSLFSTMIPKSRSAEFFSFYDVSSKFAGIIGPFVFGIVGQMTGSSRLSVVALVIFFIGGAIILSTVNEKEGRARAFS